MDQFLQMLLISLIHWVEHGIQQHSVKFEVNLQQHHLEIWLSLEMD
jgi:hypothetical protein